MRKRRIFPVAALIGFAAVPAFAASAFEGVWRVKDTAGKPFEITLAADGSATANRSGEGMKGKWTADGDAAVIAWDTGWTTRIAKDGNGYVKTASDKSQAEGGASNTSPAEKVK